MPSHGCEEASSLLRGADVALAEDEVAKLHRQTEGWAAGLYLAALYLREGGPVANAAVSFAGDDRFVSDYVKSEFLSRISRRQRAFLTRTAVLERMCGPLCDEVLEREESAAMLTDLERSNLLLVPLDRREEWYRYHFLFRDMLLAELHRREPGLIPVLQRRAAGWCLQNGLLEEALGYAIAAGDVGTAAELVEKLCLPAYSQGRAATARRWLRWLEDRGGIEGHPRIAVQAAVIFAVTGKPVEAERWAAKVDRWQSGDAAQPADPAAEAWAPLLQAILCRSGIEQMRADADEAARRFAEMNALEIGPAIYQGLRGSWPVTSAVATRSSKMRSASGRKAVSTRLSHMRWPSDRSLRWHAASGARPRPWPNRHVPPCAGPGSKRPWSARCSPAQPCIGEIWQRRDVSSSARSLCATR